MQLPMPAIAATVSALIRPVVSVIFATALKATKAILTFMMDVKVHNTKTVRSYIIRYFGANQIADF